jgi:hypothetical protein
VVTFTALILKSTQMKKLAIIFIIVIVFCNQVIIPAVHLKTTQTRQTCLSIQQKANPASAPAVDVSLPTFFIFD